PGPAVFRMPVDVYHPAVFAAGIAGLAFTPRRTRCLALVAEGGTIAATLLYGAPWTAMSAYPFVYLGAGLACAGAGRLVAWLARQPTARRSPPAAGAAVNCAAHRQSRIAFAGALAAAFVAMALTNLDLVGRPQFLLQWWSYYAGRIWF